ncbi:MAG: 5'-3' exonuclease H3TH domain-containing protein, partial [Acidimicrobiales bacterium]
VDTYKANRAKAPDTLREQMGLVRQVLDVLRLPVIDLLGFEADDIIATLASRARDAGTDVLIVTGDRDSYQLVEDPHIKVVYNKRGVSDYALYDEAGIVERTGVPPTSYVAYAALRGDPSDNLPGVAGVGEKTAAKLINNYGGIDGIYEHLADQTPKLRENLAANEEQVRLNLQVMELVRDAPVELDLDAVMTREPYDVDDVKKLFDFLEFRTLFERLPSAFDTAAVERSDDAVLQPTVSAAPVSVSLERLLASAVEIAVAPGFDGAELSGLALVPSGDPSAEVVWVPIDDLDAFAPVLGGDGPGIVAHHAKPMLRLLLDRGQRVEGLRLDTALAAYLLDPAGSSYPLVDLLPRYTDWLLPDGVAAPSGQLDFGESTVSPSMVAAGEALAVGQLAPVLAASMAADGLTALNDDVEVPLIGVLARMEHLGVGVDRDALEDLNRR